MTRQLQGHHPWSGQTSKAHADSPCQVWRRCNKVPLVAVLKNQSNGALLRSLPRIAVGQGNVPLSAVVPHEPVQRPLAQRGPVRSRALYEQRLAGGAGSVPLQQRMHLLCCARPVQRAHRPGHAAGRAATSWGRHFGTYIAACQAAGRRCACHDRGGLDSMHGRLFAGHAQRTKLDAAEKH